MNYWQIYKVVWRRALKRGNGQTYIAQKIIFPDCGSWRGENAATACGAALHQSSVRACLAGYQRLSPSLHVLIVRPPDGRTAGCRQTIATQSLTQMISDITAPEHLAVPPLFLGLPFTTTSSSSFSEIHLI